MDAMSKAAYNLPQLSTGSQERRVSLTFNDTDKDDSDPNLVTLSDLEDPRKWSRRRRWAITVLVSLVSFLTPMASSMMAPAALTIAIDLRVFTIVMNALIFSIFVLGFVVGPLFLSPLSEVFGRRVILQIATWWFLVFNLACGFAYTKGEMLTFRFLAGIGASAPLAIVGGIISDMWATEERAKAIALYALAPLLGPAVGPVVGAWITEKSTWRWAFYATSIFGAVIQVLIIFTLPETYEPRLLYLKVQRLRHQTGNQQLHSVYETEDRGLSIILPRALTRVFMLLATEPIVQFLSVYMALIYGTIYLTLGTFPLLWTKDYHESIGIGGLNYLSLAVGLVVGVQAGVKIIDTTYRRLTARAPNQESRPEFRIPILFLSIPLTSGGLFMYGWSAEKHTHWIVPNIGAAIASAGMSMTFASLQMYNIDSYNLYRASALGATAVARSLTGFAFPLFGVQMMNHLGWGWGNSLLGFIFFGIGYLGAGGLWIFGRRLRESSRFAKY